MSHQTKWQKLCSALPRRPRPGVEWQQRSYGGGCLLLVVALLSAVLMLG